MKFFWMLIFLTSVAIAYEGSVNTNKNLVPEQTAKFPAAVQKSEDPINRESAMPGKLDRAIAAALKTAADGRPRTISRTSWKDSGLASALGRGYSDFWTNEARMAAIDRLAWERAGAENMTGREYDEFKSDIARLCELVRSGIASGSPVGEGVSRKRGAGFPATPDVCETPSSGGGAVPQPEPNVGKTSGTSPSGGGESGTAKPVQTGSIPPAKKTTDPDSDSDDDDSDSSEDKQDIVGPQGPGGPLPGPINSMSTEQARSALRMQMANMILGRKQ